MAVYGVGYARTAPAANIANTDQALVVASLAATETPTTALPTATTAPSTTASSVAAATTSAIPTGTATIAAPTSTRIPTATATATAAASTASKLRDGTYTGTGTSRHGSIGVTVVVRSGKIVSADITTCGTRYPCSKIADLPGEVIVRQSANVDFVSGSTDSSTAYKAAVTAALAKAA
jgi:uncharacterized protein with FMN-binding domain